MAYQEIYRQSWTNPTSTAIISIETIRNGTQITVNAKIDCILTYSSGYVNYDGEINFNMWHGTSSASANIKGYSDRWAAGTARTRTRYCSMTFDDRGDGYTLGYNMQIPSSRPAGAAFRIDNRQDWISAPGFYAPSAPTWVNASPNPCSINSAPLLTWGGASAGTLGTLYYDVEVRSSRLSGGWTDWLRIANAQPGTSYREITLGQMSVYGQTPFVGVQYQYRVRASDGSYSTSGWITVTLSVTFGSPTSPGSYTLSKDSMKKNGSVILSWTNGSGGSGKISFYEVDYRIYNHSTEKWSDWITGYTGNENSYTFDLSRLYSLLNDTYIIKSNTNPDYVWSIRNDSTADAEKVEIWQNLDKPSQKWSVSYRGDGYYKINCVNSGRSLDVPGGEAKAGTTLQQYSENETASQKWIAIKNEDDTYSFIPALNFQLAIDIRNNEMKNGVPVQLYTKNMTTAQKFILESVEGNDTIGAVLSNGDLIQFRISTANNYGQYSTPLLTTNVRVRENQMWLKINGTWVEANTYFKNNGTWVEAEPFVKVNGAWRQSV